MTFDRLIRFVDAEGRTGYGNLDKEMSAADIIGKEVQVMFGTFTYGFTKSAEKRVVKQLLTPLPIKEIPHVLCAGLNYRLHSAETNFVIPSKPCLFITPSERLAGALDNIEAHDDSQSMLDYEGELAFIIGKDGKDIKEEDALDYVLGYTVGNDVSARSLIPIEISGNQMGHSKSFDTFGPIGPCIVSTKIIPDPQKLHLVTKVNGMVRQDVNTSEMVFTVAQIIAYVSKNRTLKKGTVVLTGTPNGVGWFADGLLGHGDVVDISISEIGTISNKVAFI